jgi:hypothetical protein
LFNNTTEDEADFCQAYKSQILNNTSKEENSSISTLSKLLTILLLLIIIVAISIYGYSYITNDSSDGMLPPSSVQMVDDDELKVTIEEEPEEKVSNVDPEIKKIEEKTTSEIKAVETPSVVKTLDMDEMANSVKLAIAKTEETEEIPETKPLEPTLDVPVESVQSAYLEELAKLSEEIDKDRK